MNLSLSKSRIASIVGVVSAVVVILQVFNVFEISNGQSVLVATEASSCLVLISAIWAHFRPGTKEEPVGLAGSITAFSSSTVAFIVGFHVVNWTDTQIAAVLATVGVVLALVTNWKARDEVTAKVTPDA